MSTAKSEALPHEVPALRFLTHSIKANGGRALAMNFNAAWPVDPVRPCPVASSWEPAAHLLFRPLMLSHSNPQANK
eukprot:8015566-Lingulodinium_polyedra.AAC.1